MFDSIVNPGRGHNPRRGAASLILALVSFAAASAVLLWPAPEARDANEPQPAPLRMVSMLIPSAPAGPSGNAGSAAKPRARTASPRPPETPSPPAAPEPDLALTAVPAAPAEGGTPGDSGLEGSGIGAGGTGAGTGGGGTGGEGTGSEGDIRFVHWSELEPTHRELPQWPAAGLALGLRESGCVIRLVVEPNGRVRGAQPRTCAAPFEAAATQAAMRWRFKEFEGPNAVQFDLNFVFRR